MQKTPSPVNTFSIDEVCWPGRSMLTFNLEGLDKSVLRWLTCHKQKLEVAQNLIHITLIELN